MNTAGKLRCYRFKAVESKDRAVAYLQSFLKGIIEISQINMKEYFLLFSLKYQ